MKVHFDNVNFHSTSGPNSFGFRLATCLKSLGHDVVLGDGRDADISLVFIEPTGRMLASKVVQRLDGIWFSPDEYAVKNRSIKQLYETCDHVIWQSNFDKEMTCKWWGLPSSGTVIHNGVSKNFKRSSDLSAQLKHLREKYEKVFVCSANWHPQKRLRSNIEFFLHVKKFYTSACLLVLGNNGDNLGIDDVFVVGSQSHDTCMQIFESSDWMLHLAWLDHCPNTVVEALSCGVPVVCSQDGGTKEIVKNYGVVLKENESYDYRLADYDSPPAIDVSQITCLPERQDLRYPPNLSIENTTAEYIDVFHNLLS